MDFSVRELQELHKREVINHVINLEMFWNTSTFSDTTWHVEISSIFPNSKRKRKENSIYMYIYILGERKKQQQVKPQHTVSFEVAFSWFMTSGSVAPLIKRVVKIMQAHLKLEKKKKTKVISYYITYHWIL